MYNKEEEIDLSDAKPLSQTEEVDLSDAAPLKKKVDTSYSPSFVLPKKDGTLESGNGDLGQFAPDKTVPLPKIVEPKKQELKDFNRPLVNPRLDEIVAPIDHRKQIDDAFKITVDKHKQTKTDFEQIQQVVNDQHAQLQKLEQEMSVAAEDTKPFLAEQITKLQENSKQTDEAFKQLNKQRLDEANRISTLYKGKVAMDAPKDKESIAYELYKSFEAGSAQLGSSLAKTPSMLYDIAALPQNLIAEYTGLPIGTSSEQAAKQFGIPENKVGEYYDKILNDHQKNIEQKYDKSISDYLNPFGENTDYGKGVSLLANQVLESAPISISLMMGNAAGLGTVATTVGGGAVFAAQKKAELDKNNPNMSESAKTSAALSNGLLEGVFENFGITKLGGMAKGVLEKEGVEAGKELIAQSFKETYTPIIKKYLGNTGEEMLSEAATQFTQNAVDKYSGAKPDLNLMDGVIDAGIVGLGSSIGFSTPIVIGEVNKTASSKKKAQQYAEAVKLKDPANAAQYGEYIDAEIAQGRMTPQQKVDIENNVKKTIEVDAKIPEYIKSDKDRYEASQLIEEKQNLQEQAKGLDGALATPMNDRIAQIDEELIKIANKNGAAIPIKEKPEGYKISNTEVLKPKVEELVVAETAPTENINQLKTTENATKEGNITENNQQQYKGATELQQGEQTNRGNQEGDVTTSQAETSGSDSSIKSGEKQKEVGSVGVGGDVWEYGNDPLQSREEGARNDLSKYDRGSTLYEKALETLNKIDNDPIWLLKDDRNYWANKKPNESWSREELDAIVRDLDKKIKQLQSLKETPKAGSVGVGGEVESKKSEIEKLNDEIDSFDNEYNSLVDIVNKEDRRLNAPKSENEIKLNELQDKINILRDKRDKIEQSLKEESKVSVSKEEPITAEEVKKEIEEEKKVEKISEAFNKAADNLRKIKNKPKKLIITDENGNDIEVDITTNDFWNAMIEIAAVAIEKTGKVADGIKAAIDYLKEQDFYKNLTPPQQAQVESQIKEEIKTASGKKFKKKERKFSKTIRRTDLKEKEEVKKLVDADPYTYTQISNNESIEEAKAFIDKYGIDEAESLATSKGSDISLEEARIANVLGMMLMEYYGIQASKATDITEKNKLLNKVVKISEATAERMTLGGQSNQVAVLWTKTTPEATLNMVTKAQKRANESKSGQRKRKKFNKAVSGYNADVESAAKGVIKSERVKKIKGEKVLSETNKEINEAKRRQLKAIDEWTKKYLATDEGGFVAATFIPPGVVKGAVKVMISAVKAGVEITAAIKKAIAYIKAQMGNVELNESILEEQLMKRYEQMKEFVQTEIKKPVETDPKIQKAVLRVEDALKRKNKQDIDNAISELQNISKSLGLWGKYKKYAVEKLQSINISQSNVDANKSPLLKKFTDELVSNIKAKIKESLPENEKKKIDEKDPRHILADAYANFEKYQEVWEEVQKAFKEKYKDNESVLDFLDNYYGELLKTPFNNKLISESIKISLKEKNQKIDDIILSHFTDRNETKQQLIDRIVNEAGVSKEAATELAKAVEEEFNKITKGGAKKIVEKWFGKIEKRGKITEADKQAKRDKNSTINRLNEALNLNGLIDNDLLLEYFGAKFGIKSLTEAQTENILKYSQAVQKSQGKFRDVATQKLINEISRTFGATPMDIFWALYYPSMLSGVSTSTLNILNNASNVASKYVENPLNPSLWLAALKLAFQNKSAKTFIYGNPLAETIMKPVYFFGKKQFKRNATYTLNEILDILKNGMLDDKFMDKQFVSGQRIETSPLEDKRIREIPVVKYAELYKYVGRFLLAQDALFFRTNEESEFISSIRRHYVDEGLTGKDLYEAVLNEVVGLDKGVAIVKMEKEAEEYEAITGQKLTNAQKNVRTIEIIRENRNKEMAEEAKQSAETMVYRGDFRGGIGWVAYTLSTFTQSKNPMGNALRLFVPFTKIVSNVFNYMVDYTPVYGLLRANGLGFTGVTQRLKKGEGLEFKGKEILPTQMGQVGEKAYYDQMGRAWLGLTAFSGLAAIIISQLDLDDDDPNKIFIVGNHAGLNREQSKNTEITDPKGTIRIGKNGTPIPYKNIPALDIPLTIIGNWMDLNRWSEGKGASEKLAMAMFASKNTFMEKSFVKGINDFNNIVFDDRLNGVNDKATQLFKTALGYATKPLPQNTTLVTQIDDIFSKYEWKAEDLQDILMYSVYNGSDVGKPKLDVFGMPYKTYPGETFLPLQSWLFNKENDPVWSKLADEGLTKKISKFGDLTLYDIDGNPLPVTKDQDYIYKAYAGREWYKMLNKYLNDEKAATDYLYIDHNYDGDFDKIGKKEIERIIQYTKDDAAKIAYYRIASDAGLKYNIKDLDWLNSLNEVDVLDTDADVTITGEPRTIYPK
jgi:hypothetical protein